MTGNELPPRAFIKKRLSFFPVKFGLAFLLLCTAWIGWGQTSTEVEALFIPSAGIISVHQQLHYQNTSEDTLHKIYLNDWNHAFATKESPLAKHFSSVYVRKYHFSDASERGETKIDVLTDGNGQALSWNRLKPYPDIIEIPLPKALHPGEKIDLKLRYTLRIPDDWLTGYGVDEEGNFNLRYWLINPAVYQKDWELYSHKNLDDQWSKPINLTLNLEIPDDYEVYSNWDHDFIETNGFNKKIRFTGKQVHNYKIAVIRQGEFDEFKIGNLKVYSDIEARRLTQEVKQATVGKIIEFLDRKLGSYPHQNLLVTQADYKTSPIYGLNQLPDFISPFQEVAQYDLKMFKTILRNYLSNSLQIDKRREEWVLNALTIYLLMDYVEEYYPDEKLIGSLSKFIGIRWTHLAELDFNAQYQLLYMNMNRLNLDQALTVSKDSLVKFNQEIANPYKAGIGLKYLEDFNGKESVEKSIKEFYEKYKLQPVNQFDFVNILKANAPKNIDWFYKEYVKTNVRLDFKIKKVKKEKDSLLVTIKNKQQNTMPVSLYGIDEKVKEVVFKTWVEPTGEETQVRIPRERITRLGLNYEGVIPEFNQRNNYKNLRSPFNKPIQFRLFKDVEDPRYSQVFFMPDFDYNLYDGFVLGSRISNQAVLAKNLTYILSPQFGFKSKDLVGHINLSYTQQFRNRNLSKIVYGFVGHRYSYAPDLFYYRTSPYVLFGWRHRDLRNKERQFLEFRNINVYRDPSIYTEMDNEPNYNVFNIRYLYSDKGLIDTYTSSVDYQLGQKFSKLSWTGKYRKLFLNNKQLEFRMFAGTFLYNKTETDYFSFSLDRATDYMFDYNYYGRSESSGLFSQQYIESEGAFKSKLSPSFANAWLASFNTSVSFYRDILYVYGDVGAFKNNGSATRVRYDSGVRLSLVQDYFEVFFPVYSNLGWEMGQSHYDQKIRFIVSLDLQTLMGLFTRTYY